MRHAAVKQAATKQSITMCVATLSLHWGFSLWSFTVELLGQSHSFQTDPAEAEFTDYMERHTCQRGERKHEEWGKSAKEQPRLHNAGYHCRLSLRHKNTSEVD